ncbi:4'-phosphopantetheinyl transferase superfamily protein [Trinickia violacea]|uniref:4'-phosphopantetheinyl transferase superfamily protein n=1 Tax=Trinickia violacea TaxID=2571746 RepID=A0A4P8IRN9_9BURK|nr:4'-phosphopantetheinyl transferase superfamily protein [Trinickia violacea]QCP50851.1 4'-phosphopantetheinyl transferase superfamily protein [Trinickia violacea]
MDRDEVLSVLSFMSRKKPDTIQQHASLGTLGISSSFGISALRSRLESTGKVSLPILSQQTTVEELITLVAKDQPKEGGLAARPIQADPIPSIRNQSESLLLRETVPGNMGLGMDMQEIESLPVAGDYRSHDFYASHFLPSEIATAMLRSNARATLCGIFCAKEAAKKSHSDLLNLRMSEIIVEHEPTGRPTMRLDESCAFVRHFQFTISITHTSQFAAATCITTWSDDRRSRAKRAGD